VEENKKKKNKREFSRESALLPDSVEPNRSLVPGQAERCGSLESSEGLFVSE
jgi:hypothetical protein